LQKAGKNWQAEAEIKNLQHIQSCAEEMLNANGLNFKPEFVAKIVCERLRMAMFGSGELHGMREDVNMGGIGMGISDEEEGRYQPSCMWDFGEERTTIPLEGEDYHWGGVFASPQQSQEEQPPADRRRNPENRFSVLRGCGERGDYYAKLNGELTPSLGARFRQFLAFQSGVEGNVTDGIKELLEQIPNDFASEESAGQILEEIRQWKELIGPREINNDDVQNLLNIIRNHALNPLIQKNIEALSWVSLNENTPLTELPLSLMFLVGLQFGQIKGGSWNPFTLAAKKYFALMRQDDTEFYYEFQDNKA
jgi:hypothetical protein